MHERTTIPVPAVAVYLHVLAQTTPSVRHPAAAPLTAPAAAPVPPASHPGARSAPSAPEAAPAAAPREVVGREHVRLVELHRVEIVAPGTAHHRTHEAVGRRAVEHHIGRRHHLRRAPTAFPAHHVGRNEGGGVELWRHPLEGGSND